MIIVDSRPRLEGKKMLESLSNAGISCTYIMINSLSYVMKEVCTPRTLRHLAAPCRTLLPVLCAFTCRPGQSERGMGWSDASIAVACGLPLAEKKWGWRARGGRVPLTDAGGETGVQGIVGSVGDASKR